MEDQSDEGKEQFDEALATLRTLALGGDIVASCGRGQEAIDALRDFNHARVEAFDVFYEQVFWWKGVFPRLDDPPPDAGYEDHVKWWDTWRARELALAGLLGGEAAYEEAERVGHQRYGEAKATWFEDHAAEVEAVNRAIATAAVRGWLREA